MVSATQQVAPNQFQDDIQAVATPASGPYLTTRASFKTAWNITKTDDDSRIDALLAQVTDLFQSLCDRQFYAAEVTEYPRILGVPLSRVFLARTPVTTPLTALYLSWSWPRVYDATTLLVEGTDYVVDEETGTVEFVSPTWYSGKSRIRAIQATYTGGYSTIPGDLERAAQEVLGVKLDKAKGHLYHVLSESRADGSIAGIRFDDMTPNALAVIDKYRNSAIV